MPACVLKIHSGHTCWSKSMFENIAAVLWDEVFFRDVYKPFMECSFYEGGILANQCKDPKSHKGTNTHRLSWDSCNALCHHELMKNSIWMCVNDQLHELADEVKIVLSLSRNRSKLCKQIVKSRRTGTVFLAVYWHSALCSAVLVELLSLSTTRTQEINSGLKKPNSHVELWRLCES